MRSPTDRRRFLAVAIAGGFLTLPGALQAQVQVQAAPGTAFEVPMLDPWAPPEVRAKANAAPPVATEGAALQEQVRAKLKRRFDAAAGPDGTLDAQQARRAGLGAIADQFAVIDRAGRGVIRFADYERFLKQRR